MSYLSISQAACDSRLRDRIAACVAQETAGGEHPVVIADALMWRCAAQPGWGEAWERALNTQNPNPGADPAVISDGMILSAVQGLIGGAG